MLITGYVPSQLDSASATLSKAPQETVWRGERCVVFAPVDSLLSHSVEEITLAFAEHAEQKKLTEARRLFMAKRKRKHENAKKIKAREAISSQMGNIRNKETDDSE